MEKRIYGLENEYGVTCVSRGQRRLSPDEVARYLFRKVVSWGRSSNVFLRNGARLYLDVRNRLILDPDDLLIDLDDLCPRPKCKPAPKPPLPGRRAHPSLSWFHKSVAPDLHQGGFVATVVDGRELLHRELRAEPRRTRVGRELSQDVPHLVGVGSEDHRAPPSVSSSGVRPSSASSPTVTPSVVPALRNASRMPFS